MSDLTTHAYFQWLLAAECGALSLRAYTLGLAYWRGHPLWN